MARTNTLGNFLTDVADAIRTKAGTSDPIQASAFDTAIANIPSGGWQRPSDWWDTETILTNAEMRDNMYPIYIILLTDASPTTTFTKTTSYKSLRYDGILTSDGSWYTADNVTHTWDTTKDKPCSLGYKTRYFIVYCSSKSVGNVNLSAFPCLEMISVGTDISFNGVLFANDGASGAPINSNITNVKINAANVFSSYAGPFRSCGGLKKISLPNVTSFSGSRTFLSCGSLEEIEVPKLQSVSNQAFHGTAVKKLSLPKLVSCGSDLLHNCYLIEELSTPLLSTISGGSAFYNCVNLRKIELPATANSYNTTNMFFACIKLNELVLCENFNISGLNLKDCVSLQKSSLLDILNKLKDNSGSGTSKTLTLGETNLAKLTASEIAIGTAKGWTIN